MLSPSRFRPCLLAAMVAASAAQMSAQVSAESESVLALEEIVVTAQKREQSLQDVPISVVAYGTEQLAAQGIDDLTDIAATVPNLVVNSFNNDPSAVRLFIRGVGQNDVQLTQDPSVALYLDGVYIGTSFGTGFEGVDVERLEVLRGPQGTLYGRNATGGAVNIVTRRASTSGLEFQQDFSTGNAGLFKSRTMVNLPLTDTLAAKVNYLISERDGFIENTGLGVDFGSEERDSVVIDLTWQASDALTLDYRYEKASMHDSQNFEQITLLNPDAFLFPFVNITDVSAERLDSASSLREIELNDLEITGHTLNADWELNDSLTFKSITAYREFSNRSKSDTLTGLEGNGAIFSGAASSNDIRTNFQQLSQEFQLLGDYDRINYVAGLYLYQDEADSTTAAIQLGQPRDTDTTATENKSIALFGEATYTPLALDERLHVTLGARYSVDNRKALRTNMNLAMPIDNAQYDKDFTNFNPSLTLSFDLNESMNVYAKAVSGFKSGGTSQRSANAILFAQGIEEEEIVSYELGFKGHLWEQRMSLNAAVFSMNIDGAQVSVQTGATPGERDFLAVDGNSIKGLEVDATILLLEGLTLNAGYSYLDTQLGVNQLESPAGTFEFIDEYSFSPKNSYNIGLNYKVDLDNGTLAASTSYSYQGDFAASTAVLSSVDHDAYGLLGASLAWSEIKFGQGSGHYKLLLWGKNLADEKYTTGGGSSWSVFGAQNVLTFGDPRSFGLTASYIY